MIGPLHGVWFLSWRHLRHQWLVSGLLVASLAVSLFLPWMATTLVARYQTQLVQRSDATPLLLGAKGNRFDLTLASLYFRSADLEPVPFGQCRALIAKRYGIAVPILLGDTARDHPIVATTVEYHEARGLAPVAGAPARRLGDAVLGANVAAALELGPGATLFSDPREIYDIARPAALKLRVTGVLPATGTPDDDAVFVDLNTGWLLEGLLHGHAEPQDLDPNLRLGGTDEDVILGPALIEINEVTPETAASFHLHADPDTLPISAVLLFPKDEKSATLAKAYVNTATPQQMVVPRAVIDDLMAVVFRVKTFFDLLTAVLGTATALLAALVVLLSMRLRRNEMRTLDRIGASPGTVGRLYLTEGLIIVGFAVALAAIAGFSLLAVVPNVADVL